ncbi:hypothetical protein KA005_44180, partial [bacterium]|nr:hypothetical protein [bacterium]
PGLTRYLRAVRHFFEVSRKKPAPKLFLLLPKRLYNNDHLSQLVKDCGWSSDLRAEIVFDSDDSDDKEDIIRLLVSISKALYPPKSKQVKLNPGVIRYIFEKSQDRRSEIENFVTGAEYNWKGHILEARAVWNAGTGYRRSVVPLLLNCVHIPQRLTDILDTINLCGITPLHCLSDFKVPAGLISDSRFLIAYNELSAEQPFHPEISLEGDSQRRFFMSCHSLFSSMLRKIRPQVSWMLDMPEQVKAGEHTGKEVVEGKDEKWLRNFIKPEADANNSVSLSAKMRSPQIEVRESDIRHSGYARARDLIVRELDSIIGSAELWRRPGALRPSIPVPVKKQIRYIVLTAIEVELRSAINSSRVQSYIKLQKENSFLTHVQRADGMLMPVILSCVGEAGRVPASIAALNLIQKYQPDFLILVGIAGSMGPTEDEDTPLGDIVIAENIIDYEPGKYRGKKLELRAVNTTCGLAQEMKQFVKDGWANGDCAELLEKSSKRKAKQLYLLQALQSEKIDIKKLSRSDVNKYAKKK